MKSHEERARELLARMTPAEKAAQLYSVWLQIEEDGSFDFRKVKDAFIKQAEADPRVVLKDGIGQIT
jgi:hypothetical protein